jgi:hypothetical protein
MTVWNKAVENGKGHGGMMVLMRKKKGRLIQLEREDSNKQFIWFKISELQHVILPLKFQKLTKVGRLTTKTPLQP